jgi:hypothetical protein
MDRIRSFNPAGTHNGRTMQQAQQILDGAELKHTI